MSTLQQEAPPAALYASPWGLLPFQQEIVVQCLARPSALVVADTGLGKTHVDLALTALLFEDAEIDVHLLVCEQNKVDEWVEDFERYTRLRAVRYAGPATKRRKIVQSLTSDAPVKIGRAKTDTVWRPQVLVGTYETFRNDMAHKVKGPWGKNGRQVERLLPHFLTDAMQGQRLLVTYDEMPKLGNRGSGLHKAHALFLEQTAAKPVGLTATPMDRDPSGYYNLGRILCPDAVGTVASFEKDHVAATDIFGNPSRFKNLTPADTHEPWATALSTKMAPVLIRKRKTDPDVVDQFPETTERFVHVSLGEAQQEFYDVVREIAYERDDNPSITVLRQIAGHPLALLAAEGEFAQEIVRQVGEAGLAALGSAKLDMLIDRLKPIVLGQGAQAVVFTFFGPSMIPLIQRRLEEEGMGVALNYPAIGEKVRRDHKAEFQAGHRQVFLTSDAGARGINLPQASYVFEYEGALTHSNRTQRFNRIHRIDSTHDKVWFNTLVARDTVEEGLLDNALRRNQWSDELLGDEDAGERFVSAKDRKRLLSISRRQPV